MTVCAICGGDLERSDQYPNAGLVHKYDKDDADGHQPEEN
jgi:hypothetical protein